MSGIWRKVDGNLGDSQTSVLPRAHWQIGLVT
jgi:hypothetical protein